MNKQPSEQLNGQTEPAPLSLRTRLLLVIVALLITLVLALVLGDFVRETLAEPLAYLLWAVRIIIESIPQPLLWALLWALAVLVIARSLVKHRPRAAALDAPLPHPTGRVSKLVRRIRYAAHSRYSRQRLAAHLAQLTVEALAQRTRVPAAEIRRQIRAGDIKAPPEVTAYLQIGLTHYNPQPMGLLTWLVRRWREETRPRPTGPEPSVKFLEQLMEVHHDTHTDS